MRVKKIGVDWGEKGGKLTFWDGETGGVISDLVEWLLSLPPETKVLIESSFGSFTPGLKNAAIAAAKKAGVWFKTINPRETRYKRNSMGLPKSDENDAKAIQQMLAEGKKHFADPKPERFSGEVSADEVFEMQCQRAGVGVRRSKYSEEETAEYMRLLPSIEEASATAEGRRAIGALATPDGKAWVNVRVFPLVIYASEVVKKGGGRQEYERLLGSYGHGKPSLARSNFYHHGVKELQRKAQGTRKLSENNDEIVRKKCQQDLRWAARNWLFREVRKRVTLET